MPLKKHPETPLLPLYTHWGEKIRIEETPAVWQEYPRPQLERDNYRILNGNWSCRFNFQSFNMVYRHPLIPHALPDAALGRVEHAAPLQRLLSSGPRRNLTFTALQSLQIMTRSKVILL